MQQQSGSNCESWRFDCDLRRQLRGVIVIAGDVIAAVLRGVIVKSWRFDCDLRWQLRGVIAENEKFFKKMTVNAH